MKPYHKIESLFVRDMEGTKKLIEGKFRSPLVRYLSELDWTFTEKVDGTNIRVHWDGHNVIYGGRTDNAQLPSFLINDVLVPKFSGTVNEQVFEQKFGETPVTLYGEGYGPKIQNGGLYRDDPGFILFDVMVGDIILERDQVEDIAISFGLDVVPIVMMNTIDKAVEFVKSNPKSKLSKQERPMEGLVGTPLVRAYDHKGDRVIVKIKAEDFV